MYEQVEIFNPREDWRALLSAPIDDTRPILAGLAGVIDRYLRDGIQSNSGLIKPLGISRSSENNIAAMAAILRENPTLLNSPGAITPDLFPDFFRFGIKSDGTKEYPADTSYTDWMRQTTMINEVEDRSEWDANVKFVLMKEAGSVNYNYVQSTDRSMRNFEYGTGFKIYRTWLETNMFGIKMNSLVPKVKWEYFDSLSEEIYTGLSTLFVTGLIGGNTNRLIKDINQAIVQLKRLTNTYGKEHFASASFRVIAPIELEPYINAALAMSYDRGSREVLTSRVSATFTTKLAAGAANARVFYVVVDKWEQNELGVRVPLGVFGQFTDIETFCDKISWREAHGINLDPTSGIKITVDTTHADFSIAGPFETMVLP